VQDSPNGGNRDGQRDNQIGTGYIGPTTFPKDPSGILFLHVFMKELDEETQSGRYYPCLLPYQSKKLVIAGTQFG